MSDGDHQTTNSAPETYTVVARRYRPKHFEQLIGQDHIAAALGKAIETGRVGHAYLFTGARGVGKTSSARIFAKLLNTLGVEPDLRDEISQSIDAGDDMDVIEIDGASNRGIEEIRQLRANVNVRPSRSPFKIYIIDEVHMLTNQAFNALLKTLEEPPAHVKFIFCTTDPDKIPITVLSRCQRFDFSPVKFEAIKKRLQEISIAEGFDVDDDALALLARKASGSMRDSQSLLEQVMSFSNGRITADQVHALLGTADEGRLFALADNLCRHDSLAALRVVDEAIRSGADPGQLAEQFLNYMRDLMAVGVGGTADILKLANPAGFSTLRELGEAWGLSTILSAIQILDESLVRMRASVSAVTLLEVAVVQIAELHQLQSIPALLEALSGSSANTKAMRPTTNVSRPADEKKNAELTLNPSTNATSAARSLARSSTTEGERATPKTESLQAATQPPHTSLVTSKEQANEPSDDSVASSNPVSNVRPLSVTEPKSSKPPGANPLIDWKAAVQNIDGMLADFAGMAVDVQPQGSDHWKIIFGPGNHKPREHCEVVERRNLLQQALRSYLGREIRLSFETQPGEATKATPPPPQATLRVQQIRQIAEHPYIKKLCEALDGEILRVDSPSVTTGPNQQPANAKAHR